MSVEPELVSKPVVLVVDDEALLRMLAGEVLRDAGYHVIEAGTTAQAIAALHVGHKVRAVFTDVHMPGSPDGLGLAWQVREICPDCAIVVASGRHIPTPDELPPGAMFMSKPYSVDAVVLAFDEMLGT